MAGVSLAATLPPGARDRMRFMTTFVRVAGIYNVSAIVVLLTPGL